MENKKPVAVVHIEADDVAHLVDKQWIGGQFEGFRTRPRLRRRG